LKSIKNNSILLQVIFHNFFAYILYINNIQGSLIGQTLINLNISIENKNNKILIPYIKTKNLKKYSLVLDLEETLLHFRKDKTNENEGTVDIRSGTLKFLDDISEFYELIVFNEGERQYTDLLIDSLEENKIYFEHRFYREHIVIVNNDIVKDLVRIGRNLDKILIIDNMQQNFKLQKENGILIKSFYGENDNECIEDNVLGELSNILIKIAKDGGDIRNGVVKYQNEIINKVTLENSNFL
jgi:RNA polymerase II subunit A small phosphatase-like protein